MEYKHAVIGDLVADAKELGPEAKKFLRELIQSEKNGKPLTYLTIRKEYFLKFHPEDMPKQKPRSMRDYLAELED